MRNTKYIYNRYSLDSVPSTHIVVVFVHTLFIPCLITAKDLVKSNRLSQNIVSNTLRVASYGCNRFQYVVLGDVPHFDKNDATDCNI